MGVPAFFRWLTRKYPSVIVHCVEQKAVDVNGVHVPRNTAEPNPNGVEFDNLYLDMNGIIHPCTHPEDRPAPRNEDEMMVAIFECIDRMFNIVRPRKLLYMAIDGVAPRAKMNQQRSRRFRASKETVEKDTEVKRIRAELLLRGASLPAEKAKEAHFDSNCITPGTPFMARLSDCLHYYIHERLNNDPGWQGIKVILSDANVPGEGEHKIMDYIRKQRSQSDHDPNTQHCLCGADADLIMLGLATHEPNFTIIREEFKPNKPRPCEICGQIGHEMKDCIGGAATSDTDVQKVNAETDYIFVRLNVLKEYLQRELAMQSLPFKYEFERALDDWVFMCFFVGNDFLPHLPSLEIREGAIDRLIRLYKDCVFKIGGWLTNSGDVNLDGVQVIMNELGKVEDEIFKTRQQKELQFKARDKAKRRRSDGYNQWRPNFALVKDTQFAPRALGQTAPVVNVRQEAFNIRKAGMHTQSSSSSSNAALESMLVTNSSETGQTNSNRGQKRPLEEDKDEGSDDDQAHDEVRLWEDGFKDRYYESKFDVGAADMEFRTNVALHYVRGLCWVLRYYYQGCASWKWYFPYHYAPFASDFVHISGLSTEFEEDTQPFKPLEQLMSVFPAASSQHVPAPWAKLMSDPESTIIDFYPEDFKIDLNGKKFAWQGVALLPFVDEDRLFKALEPLYDELTVQEKRRNMRGDDRLYVGKNNTGYDNLQQMYTQKISIDMEVHVSIDGMQGLVLLSEQNINFGGFLDSPIVGLDDISNNIVCCVRYRDPHYRKGFIFPARKLKGAVDPPTVLKPQDLDAMASQNWRAQVGMAPATQRAFMGQPGRRMLNHHTQPRYEPGPYANVPPPMNMDRHNNYRSRGGGSGHYSGGGGSSWGGGGGYQNRGNSNYQNRSGGHNSHQGGYSNFHQQQNYNQRQQGFDKNRPDSTRNQANNQTNRRPPGPYVDGYQTSNYYSQNNYRR